jgi:ATP-binding cassette subfamily F protein 3
MLQIRDLSFTAWGRRFFEDANLTLPAGVKAGLVGRNGAGKSTLFKLILGELTPSGGNIATPRGWRIASVDQEVASSPTPLIEAVLALDFRRARLLAELDAAAPERQAELHADLAAIGAERAPARAAEILSGLGFDTAHLERPMSDFSGGWRMRATLAGALLAEPDLLLLDEPTNYLDLEGALWLEARLKRYPNAALVISHDRELLNNSVQAIVHLSESRLDYYSGSFDLFERQRGERLRLREAERVKQEAERAHLQSFVDRFRAKASKARQAQSRIKRLEKLAPIPAVVDERTAPFLLPSPEKPLPPPLIRLERASVGYGEQAVLRGLSLRLDLDDRIGLLGVNGAGKSTFAKLLADALEPMAGEVWKDRRLKVGWFHQHQIEALDPRETPLDIIRRRLPDLGEAQRRARLGAFGFDASRAETRAQDLSGGERARLLLNLVAMERPHLLILDEPTNHLDIDSRRALLEALNDYEGAVVIVTHDRSLMELVADRLWLTAEGTVRPFEGDLDDYARFVLDRAKASAAAASEGAPATRSARDQRKAAAEARQRISPLKKRVEAAERKMESFTRQIADLNAALADPELFRRDPAKAAELGRQRARAEEGLASSEQEWLAAAQDYEDARAAAGLG